MPPSPLPFPPPALEATHELALGGTLRDQTSMWWSQAGTRLLDSVTAVSRDHFNQNGGASALLQPLTHEHFGSLFGHVYT